MGGNVLLLSDTIIQRQSLLTLQRELWNLIADLNAVSIFQYRIIEIVFLE